MSGQATEESRALGDRERQLFQEALRALNGLRYGSVVLTVHEGRLVEVQTTQRIRAAGSGK